MGFRFEALDGDRDVALNTLARADADALADHCKALHNAGAGNGTDMKLAMRVDPWFVIDWCNKRGVTFEQFNRDQALMNAFLDDPDLSMFRVWKGRV